jgi:hypothetical protein
MYIGLHSKYSLFLPDFNKELNFIEEFSKKFSNIKFYGNSSSESRIVPCGRKDGQADATKLIVIFRSFANAPKTTKNIQLLAGLFPRSKAAEI